MSHFLTILALIAGAVAFAIGVWMLVFWLMGTIGGPLTAIVVVVLMAALVHHELNA